jgi:hypothetical protein
LQKGPLPIEQVLQYAIEIADALDKAHRKGITHRDLKPGNVMLAKSGTKLLDFGLAKLKQEVSPVIPESQMPTMKSAVTAEGTILGTLQYMAPEQVEGKQNEIDARTDIFAFGAVVYEMATGKRAFEGKSSASVMAAILVSDPPPMSTLQPVTPPALDRVVKRCLAKEPEKRWQTASDLCEELKWIAEGGSQAGPLTAAPKEFGTTQAVFMSRTILPWFAAAALGIIAVGASFIAYRATRPVDHPLMRFTDDLGVDVSFNEQEGPSVAISPDGLRLAYLSQSTEQPTHISMRLLENSKSMVLAGTEGAAAPFFSPDGRWIGFFTGSTLKKISVEGGAAVTICEVSGTPRGGGFWGEDGNI